MNVRHIGRALVAASIAVVLCAAAAYAQQRPKLVGILSPFAPSEPGIDAFRRELIRLGWSEGDNLTVTVEAVHGRLEKLPQSAAALVRRMPDVIFAPGEQGLAAAKNAGSIPIVTVACDPLDRLIATLAAPGGTATGLTCINSELAGKRLELLRELIPDLARVGVLYNASDPNKPQEFDELRVAGERFRFQMRGFGVTEQDGIIAAFRAAEPERIQAFIVLVDALMIFHRQIIVDAALRGRFPTIFGFKEFVEAGGLMSYGASREALFKRAAAYVDKILRGAKAGELPVEQPTIFEMYLNRETAHALGLTIPHNLLVRADEVIE